MSHCTGNPTICRVKATAVAVLMACGAQAQVAKIYTGGEGRCAGSELVKFVNASGTIIDQMAYDAERRFLMDSCETTGKQRSSSNSQAQTQTAGGSQPVDTTVNVEEPGQTPNGNVPPVRPDSVPPVPCCGGGSDPSVIVRTGSGGDRCNKRVELDRQQNGAVHIGYCTITVAGSDCVRNEETYRPMGLFVPNDGSRLSVFCVPRSAEDKIWDRDDEIASWRAEAQDRTAEFDFGLVIARTDRIGFATTSGRTGSIDISGSRYMGKTEGWKMLTKAMIILAYAESAEFLTQPNEQHRCVLWADGYVIGVDQDGYAEPLVDIDQDSMKTVSLSNLLYQNRRSQPWQQVIDAFMAGDDEAIIVGAFAGRLTPRPISYPADAWAGGRPCTSGDCTLICASGTIYPKTGIEGARSYAYYKVEHLPGPWMAMLAAVDTSAQFKASREGRMALVVTRSSDNIYQLSFSETSAPVIKAAVGGSDPACPACAHLTPDRWQRVVEAAKKDEWHPWLEGMLKPHAP